MLSRRMPSLAFYFVWMADVSTARVDEQAEAVAERSARLATGAWDAAVAKTEPHSSVFISSKLSWRASCSSITGTASRTG